MNIVVDKDLPLARSAFGSLGDVRLIATAALTPSALEDVDAVIVRSTGRIDANLLEGSRVKFVGTATIGTDHVDVEYLTSRGIAFESAPGSNANSVKEYLVGGLLELSATYGWSLKGSTIGIVGVGHVGSRVRQAADALGMRVLLNDPPLARQTGDRSFLPLDELMNADIITLHVPLTRSGPDPTFHLFDEKRLDQLKKGAIFINTSRGAVVSTPALRNAIDKNHIRYSIIDVWENEPNIDLDLLKIVTLGTPHIAGYSMEGRTNAVRMMRDALCRHFRIDSHRAGSLDQLNHRNHEITVRSTASSAELLLHEIVSQSYDITTDDLMLRRAIDDDADKRGEYFSHLRDHYRERYEFPRTTVRLPQSLAQLSGTLISLGFSCRVVGEGSRV